MSPKLFDLTQREEARVRMLDAGFQLIKEQGMTHASVEKVMKVVGLGKSTFYNFFPSKEMFVYEIIRYQRDRAKKHFIDVLGDREKMTVPEGKEFLKKIIFSEDSIYQYLTAEDEAKLWAALPPEYRINAETERQVINTLLTHMEGVRKDIDFKVVANLIKVMALSLFHRNSLHADALERTFDRIYELLFSCIFEEDA